MTARERREAAFPAMRAAGQVDPSELVRGKRYTIPSHGSYGEYEIVSVGRKWITALHHGVTTTGKPRRWRVLRSGWDGPYFKEVAS